MSSFVIKTKKLMYISVADKIYFFKMFKKKIIKKQKLIKRNDFHFLVRI